MNNKCFRPEYLFRDTPHRDGEDYAAYSALDVKVNGDHVYGVIMWPDGSYTEPRPCVIFFHGFPGTGRNDDLLFSLRRAGCVCVNVHHRGAWGSQGKYLVSNCVEDAVTIARHVHSKAFCTKYNVDPDKIFLAGHSMGGNTSVNAARKLKWLKGIILLAPYNAMLSLKDPKATLVLMKEGLIMHTDGAEAMQKDLTEHAPDYRFDHAALELRDMNICCICGSADPLIDYDTAVKPLFDTLKKEGSTALHRVKILPATHGLDQGRVAMIRFAAKFIADLVN